MYPSMNSGTGLLRDAGMFKEGYRDTSLDRGTGLYWLGGGGGGVQDCTVGTGLYRGKGVYMQGGVQGTSQDRGTCRPVLGWVGGGGGCTGLYSGYRLVQG